MRVDQISQLKTTIENAANQSGAFVEWIDEDEIQHVIVGVVPRDGEADPVAMLSTGGYVVLTDADPCDFRLVSPAVAPDPLSLPTVPAPSPPVALAQ